MRAASGRLRAERAVAASGGGFRALAGCRRAWGAPGPPPLPAVRARAPAGPPRRRLAAGRPGAGGRDRGRGPAALPPRHAAAECGFASYANWLVKGRLMVGRYPYVERGRCREEAQGREQVAAILGAGITTFVSLQDELPPQPEMPEGLHELGFRPYYRVARELAAAGGASAPPEFVKYSIVDLTAPTFEYLDEIVEDLAGRVERGENVYVHCWAGRGRAAVVSGCVLAKLYGLPAHDALEYVGKAYATRGDERRQSPETLDQRRLMSRWIIAKVPSDA